REITIAVRVQSFGVYNRAGGRQSHHRRKTDYGSADYRTSSAHIVVSRKFRYGGHGNGYYDKTFRRESLIFVSSSYDFCQFELRLMSVRDTTRTKQKIPTR